MPSSAFVKFYEKLLAESFKFLIYKLMQKIKIW